LVVPMSLAVSMARAEVDQQITTARAYPRSIKQVTDRIYSLATLDKESAEESMYALPRGGKPITGPSIRFAEIVKQSYGNCRAAARVVHVDRNEKFVEAEGVFHDLETNTATTARVRRRIVDSKGRLYSDDMIIVTGNAACSIALRNAIMSGVPKPLWRRAFEAVMGTIKGDVTTLTENRTAALKAFAMFGVKPDQIFAALGLVGEADITVEHIPLLRGMFATLKNGESTVEEMFGATTAPGTAPQTLHAGFEDAKGTGKKAAKPKPPAPEAEKPAPAAENTTPAAEVAKTEPTATQEATAASEEGLPAALQGLGDGDQAPQTADEPDATADQVAEGYPAADEVYHLTGDSWGADGRRDTYKNGVPFSTSTGKAGLVIYEDHAPEGPGGVATDDAAGEAAAEGGAEDDGFPPEFSTYIHEVENAKSWVEVKKAMQTFYTTELFKNMVGAQQNQVRANTWDTCVEANISDLPDPTTDASAFRLWTEASTDPDAILNTLSALEASPAFASKDENFRGVIRSAAEKRVAALRE
jgi:hypothetical protein